MKFWPRKPEPVLNWRLSQPLPERLRGYMVCANCGHTFDVLVLDRCVIGSCDLCKESNAWVDSLPYSVQDHYLEFIEQDLEA